MDKKSILTKIFAKKDFKDYTYSILFFLISSFFLIFAVRPALSIAFGLKREVGDLREVNDLYERNLLKLVEIQSSMEQVRDKLYLLKLAIPERPYVYNFIDEIQKSALLNNLTISDIDIKPIDLKEGKDPNEKKQIYATLQISGTYSSVRGFLAKLTNQRRLKTIKKLQISRGSSTSTESATLNTKVEIEAFHL